MAKKKKREPQYTGGAHEVGDLTHPPSPAAEEADRQTGRQADRQTETDRDRQRLRLSGTPFSPCTGDNRLEHPSQQSQPSDQAVARKRWRGKRQHPYVMQASKQTGRDRQRETDTETETETDRDDKQRQTDTDGDRQRDRDRNRDGDGHRHRHRHGPTHKRLLSLFLFQFLSRTQRSWASSCQRWHPKRSRRTFPGSLGRLECEPCRCDR